MGTDDDARTDTFRFCWVNTNHRYTETVFHDATRVVATPSDGFDYRNLAGSLGYRGPEAHARMAREHEILHTFLAERLQDSVLPTLWAVAHDFAPDVTAPVREKEIEEVRVLAFQSFLNNGATGPLRDRTAWEAGRDVAEMGVLRADTLALLRPAPDVPHGSGDRDDNREA